MKHHPDKNPTIKKLMKKYLKKFNAYDVLKDPEKRRIYDDLVLEV